MRECCFPSSFSKNQLGNRPCAALPRFPVLHLKLTFVIYMFPKGREDDHTYERQRTVRCPKYSDTAIDELFWRVSGRHYRGVVGSADIKSYALTLFFFPHYCTSFGKLPKTSYDSRMVLCPLFSKIQPKMPCFGLPQKQNQKPRCLFPPFCRTQNGVQGTFITSLPAKTYQKCFARQGWRRESRRYRCDERGVCENLHTRN